MVAARAREIYDAQAKERQVESGRNHGRGKVPENLPEPINAGDARDKAGKAVGVSGRSVDFATKVLSQGEPELIKAVDEKPNKSFELPNCQLKQTSCATHQEKSKNPTNYSSGQFVHPKKLSTLQP
jgi:hypothetical protein